MNVPPSLWPCLSMVSAIIHDARSEPGGAAAYALYRMEEAWAHVSTLPLTPLTAKAVFTQLDAAEHSLRLTGYMPEGA